jgi:hypothetical protein
MPFLILLEEIICTFLQPNSCRNRSYKTLRKGGRFLVYGAQAVTTGESMLSIGLNFLKIKISWDDHGPVVLYSVTEYKKKHVDHYQQDLDVLCGLLEQGTIKPIIYKNIAKKPHKLDDVTKRLPSYPRVGEIRRVQSPQRPQKKEKT